jgi:type IX secretion system PorP/SprF family membrane protein
VKYLKTILKKFKKYDMKAKSIITCLSIAALAITAPVSQAQDIHFTQFDMQPLVVNPAFTGMFYGKVRANAIYRDQWRSVTNAYRTYGASVDLPIKSTDGGYLAGGLQMYQDVAGDGALTNFTGLASIAYHKTFGGDDVRRGSDLSFGLQGGYAQKSVDLSRLFFADEFQGGGFTQGSSQEYRFGLGNSINYFLVNAGVSYAHSFSERFSMVLGGSANNLNRPTDAMTKKPGSEAVLDMRYTGQFGAIWKAGDKLSLRPAVLVQSQASAMEMVYGNEFHYAMTDGIDGTQFTPAIFAGVWMRQGDATMITAGFEAKNFRVGVAYDYNTSALNTASNGRGGFEIAVRYISPYSVFSAHRTIACSRF